MEVNIRAVIMRATRILKIAASPKINKESLEQIERDCRAILEVIDNCSKKSYDKVTPCNLFM